MGIQANYPEFLDVGFEGGFADSQVKVCVTGVNESEAMPFGRAVQFDSTGTVDRSVKLMDGAAPTIMGFTGLSHFHESFDESLTGVAQVTTVTVGGAAADGNYDIFVDGFLSRFVRAAAEANAAIATALRLAINDNPNVNTIVTATGAGVDVVITKDTPGSFSTDTAVTGGGTLVDALTTGGEADGVKQNEEANVLRKGSIWLRPEDAVTPASGVFVRITANAGVGTALGAVRGTADGGNTTDISANAKWLTSSVGGEAGGLAKLSVNFD